MNGVFISYRGEDSRSYGVFVHSELSRRFGPHRVFLDSESTRAGDDFVAVMRSQLQTCSVLLVLIGPRWLSVADSAGQRRIDAPQDWVRRELMEAHKHGLRVIPILTDGAEIPGEAELPADIAWLSRCQYRRLDHRNASHDLTRIAEELTRLDPDPTETGQREVNSEATAIESSVIVSGPLRVELSPSTAAGRTRGCYRLMVRNIGGVPIAGQVRAEAPHQVLTFRADPEQLHLPPGGHTTATVRVKPQRWRWSGTEVRHPLRIGFLPADGDPVFGDATLVQRPIIPRWGLVATGVGTVLALSAGLLVSALVPASKGDPPLQAGGSDTPTTSNLLPTPSPAPASPTFSSQPLPPTTPRPPSFTSPPQSPPKFPPPPPSPTDPPTTQRTTEPPPPPPQPFTGTLTLPENVSGNLDPEQGSENDVYYGDENGFRVIRNANSANTIRYIGRPEQLAEESCTTLGSPSYQSFKTDDLRMNDVICFTTSEGRLSAIRLQADPQPSPWQLNVAFITWL